MTDDLVAFLSARLDEDEAAAKAAAEDLRYSPACPVPWRDDFGDLVDADGKLIVDGVGYGGVAWANVDAVTHIARHDPARVLREVAAKRAIVNECRAVTKLTDLTDLDPGGYRDWIVHQFAAVYADHPDYRPEWRPR